MNPISDKYPEGMLHHLLWTILCVMKSIMVQLVYFCSGVQIQIDSNPCPAEPGYALPLQTV